jgi:hypothetical protein
MAYVKKTYRVWLSHKEGFFTIEVTVITRFGKKPQVLVESKGQGIEFVGESAEW